PVAAPQSAAEAPRPPAVPAPALAEAPVVVPEPSFDVIRIEPDGQSIIAGRAAPDSQWILLNNGKPIAAVQADTNGEWVVLPENSLLPGVNAFSLVPKTERGRVVLPEPTGPEPPLAPSTAAEPAAAPPQQGAEAVPPVGVPRPKPQGLRALPVASSPSFRSTAGGTYEVQLASVRESRDAERELARLAAAFPALLGDIGLRVLEAELDGAGTFYRVRSGAIDDLGSARELCRQLEAGGQGCLAVRRRATDETAMLPEPAETADDHGAAPEPAEPRPAPQQAERPR